MNWSRSVTKSFTFDYIFSWWVIVFRNLPDCFSLFFDNFNFIIGSLAFLFGYSLILAFTVQQYINDRHSSVLQPMHATRFYHIHSQHMCNKKPFLVQHFFLLKNNILIKLLLCLSVSFSHLDCWTIHNPNIFKLIFRDNIEFKIRQQVFTWVTKYTSLQHILSSQFSLLWPTILFFYLPFKNTCVLTCIFNILTIYLPHCMTALHTLTFHFCST